MRPLWWAEEETPHGTARYVASTQDIFHRAVPELAPKEVSPLTLLRVGEITVEALSEA